MRIDPIRSAADIERAVKQAAGDPSAQWYVTRMAKAFGAIDQLPDAWKPEVDKIVTFREQTPETDHVAVEPDLNAATDEYLAGETTLESLEETVANAFTQAHEVNAEDALAASLEARLTSLVAAGHLSEDEQDALLAAAGKPRRVRTPEGAKKFGQPINTIITPKGAAPKMPKARLGQSSSSALDSEGKPSDPKVSLPIGSEIELTDDAKQIHGVFGGTSTGVIVKKKTVSAGVMYDVKLSNGKTISNVMNFDMTYESFSKASTGPSKKTAPETESDAEKKSDSSAMPSLSVPAAPAAPSSKKFVSGKQTNHGTVNAAAKKGDPDHEVPKVSFADGTRPKVGSKVVDKNGNTGTVVKTYQAYTAVKWDHTGKSKTVKNDTLNTAGDSSTSEPAKPEPKAPEPKAPEPKTDDSPTLVGKSTKFQLPYEKTKSGKITALNDDGTYQITTPSGLTWNVKPEHFVGDPYDDSSSPSSTPFADTKPSPTAKPKPKTYAPGDVVFTFSPNNKYDPPIPAQIVEVKLDSPVPHYVLKTKNGATIKRLLKDVNMPSDPDAAAVLKKAFESDEESTSKKPELSADQKTPTAPKIEPPMKYRGKVHPADFDLIVIKHPDGKEDIGVVYDNSPGDSKKSDYVKAKVNGVAMDVKTSDITEVYAPHDNKSLKHSVEELKKYKAETSDSSSSSKTPKLGDQVVFTTKLGDVFKGEVTWTDGEEHEVTAENGKKYTVVDSQIMTETSDDSTSAASAEAPKPQPFVSNKQIKINGGVIDTSLKAGDPGHDVPKVTFGDGTAPLVGKKIVTKDGKTGTVLKTYQGYTAVEFDDGGKKTVNNKSLNTYSGAATGTGSAPKVSKYDPKKVKTFLEGKWPIASTIKNGDTIVVKDGPVYGITKKPAPIKEAVVISQSKGYWDNKMTYTVKDADGVVYKVHAKEVESFYKGGNPDLTETKMKDDFTPDDPNKYSPGVLPDGTATYGYGSKNYASQSSSSASATSTIENKTGISKKITEKYPTADDLRTAIGNDVYGAPEAGTEFPAPGLSRVYHGAPPSVGQVRKNDFVTFASEDADGNITFKTVQIHRRHLTGGKRYELRYFDEDGKEKKIPAPAIVRLTKHDPTRDDETANIPGRKAVGTLPATIANHKIWYHTEDGPDEVGLGGYTTDPAKAKKDKNGQPLMTAGSRDVIAAQQAEGGENPNKVFPPISHEEMREISSDLVDDMAESEVATRFLSSYVGHSGQINTALREGKSYYGGGELSENELKSILKGADEVDRVMDENGAPRDMTIVRIEDAKYMEKRLPEVGMIFRDKGYTSATSSTTKAKQIVHGLPGTSSWSSSATLEIKVPKGTPLAYLDAVQSKGGNGTIGYEHEFLLKRGTAFKILEIKTDKSGRPHYVLEIVPWEDRKN